MASSARIQYSAVGFDKHGRYVNVLEWGDWVNIQADGFETVERAMDHAPTLFAQSTEVAWVGIQESIQERPGSARRAGHQVTRVERESAL